MSRKIIFIVNPESANGSTGKKWLRIQSKAEARLGQFEAFMTTSPGHAKELARQALKKNPEVVVCVGDDGTLNEVINGLFDRAGALNPDVRLGYLPSGTGGDLAKSLPFPKDIDRALDNILQDRWRLIDLGRLTYRDHLSQTCICYFHNILSFGLGGEVDERVNQTTKAFGGFFSFIWATLSSILCYEKKRIRLCVDDHFDEEVTMWNVAVSNGQYHGGGMRVAPGAVVDDGLFQITVIGNLSKPDVFRSLPLLYNGKIYEHPKVSKLTGKCIRAESAQRVQIDMDGEQPGQLPLSVEVVPSCLRIICEAEPRPEKRR